MARTITASARRGADVPLSALGLPEDLLQVFQSSGAKTAADAVLQVTAPSLCGSEVDIHTEGRVDRRLTDAQKAAFSGCLNAMKRTAYTDVMNYVSWWSAPCGGMCEAFVTEALNLLNTDADLRSEVAGRWNDSITVILEPDPYSFPKAGSLSDKETDILCTAVERFSTNRSAEMLSMIQAGAEDQELVHLLYRLRYSPEACAQITGCRDAREIETWRRKTLGLWGAFACDFLHSPVWDSWDYSDEEEFAAFDEDHEDWAAEIVKKLFPRSRPGDAGDQTCADKWVKSLIEAAAADCGSSGDLPPVRRVMMLHDSCTRKDLSTCAAHYKINLYDLEGELEDLRTLLRRREIKELFDGGCPYGNRADHELLSLNTDSARLPDKPLQYLCLGGQLELRLLSLFDQPDCGNLIRALWSVSRPFHDFMLSELGTKAFYGLRAYFNFLGASRVSSALHDPAVANPVSGYVSRLFSPAEAGMPPARDDREEEAQMLVLESLTAKALLGAGDVPGFTPTRAGTYVLFLRGACRCSFATIDRFLAQAGLEELEERSEAYCDRVFSPLRTWLRGFASREFRRLMGLPRPKYRAEADSTAEELKQLDFCL